MKIGPSGNNQARPAAFGCKVDLCIQAGPSRSVQLIVKVSSSVPQPIFILPTQARDVRGRGVD